ncbi:MAG: hypothetical protein RKL24_10095 [Defluviicoccus sp.]|nr:hypothetical protein [Defluviicoccus sp.]
MDTLIADRAAKAQPARLRIKAAEVLGVSKALVRKESANWTHAK